MTITAQTQADIRRLYYVEHFTMNAIGEALGIHHDTVKENLDTSSFSLTPHHMELLDRTSLSD